MRTKIDFLKQFEDEFKKTKKRLTITVSGPASSGKTTGAKAIASAFNLRYFSAGEIFRDMAKKRRIPLERFSEIREREVDYEIDKNILRLAMEGNCVLDGRLTGWAAGDHAEAKIYYECSLKTRAERAAKRDKKPFEESLRDIKRRDEEDNKKYKKLYGIDLFDKSIYNVIINNEKITLRENEIIAVKRVRKIIKKALKNNPNLI